MQSRLATASAEQVGAVIEQGRTGVMSVMFDRDTLVIGYDQECGEPRGKKREQGRKTDLKAAQLGHCIGCGLCVQVCHAGIDRRNCLQYECIGCAACVGCATA